MAVEYQNGLVSVIVPTYNRGPVLLKALESIYAQDYRPIEVIVVDDGSTDNTGETVQKWADSRSLQLTFIVKYLFQTNKGAAAARNIGLPESRGEFIQFLDSDDLLAGGKLAAQVRALRAHPEYQGAYCSWRSLFDASIIEYGPLRQKEAEQSEDSMLRGYLAGSWFVPLHAYLFVRRAVLDVGPWSFDLVVEDDTDYLIRMLLNGCKFLYVPEGLVFYRRHFGTHVSSLRREGLLLKQMQATTRVRENAFAILEDRGLAAMYGNEFRAWFERTLTCASEFGEKLSTQAVNPAFQKMLSGVDIDHKKIIVGRLIRAVAGLYLVRLFRYKIGDCAIMWLSAYCKKLKEGMICFAHNLIGKVR